MVPRLASDVMRGVVETAWANVEAGEPGEPRRPARFQRDEAAEAAFVALSCVSRELSDLCRRYRWSTVTIRSNRSMATARTILSRSLIQPHVRKIAIRVHAFSFDHFDPTFSPEEVEELRDLLCELKELQHFALALAFDKNGETPIQTLHDGFAGPKHDGRQLLHTFASAPRSNLVVLVLEGGEHGTLEVPGVALGSVLAGSPRLRSLYIWKATIIGTSLGLQAVVSLPRVVDFAVMGTTLSAGAASGLGRCIGPFTAKLNIVYTSWTMQRIMLSEASRTAPGDIAPTLEWAVGGAADVQRGGPDGLEAWTEWIVQVIPGLEATCSPEGDRIALVHAANATCRPLHWRATRFRPSFLAGRLSDPSYGRNLRLISIAETLRDEQLEKVCASRGIDLDYYRCAFAAQEAR